MTWNGSRDHLGYGKFNGRRRVSPVAAHRLAWEFCNGPIPARLEIDHLCRNKGCVRPDHLDLVTHRENMLRAYAIKPKSTTLASIRTREWRRTYEENAK